MLINNLDIKEFRGIKKCNKKLEFSKFNVLIGRNNSGKSAIIGALSLFPNPEEKGMLPLIGRTRFDNLELFFHHADSAQMIYAYSGKAELEYNNGELKIEIRRDAWNYSPKKEKNRNKIISALISGDNEIMQHFYNTIKERHEEIIKSGAHVRVAKAISECVSDNYTEIYPETMRIRKVLPSGNAHYIRIEDLGDGAKKAIEVMLLLELIKPKIVLWDDFETSAHPSLLRMLLSWLCKKEWQVFLSTHSIDVLYQLLEIRPENSKIIQLSKDEEDALSHKDLELEEIERIMETGNDPRLVAEALVL